MNTLLTIFSQREILLIVPVAIALFLIGKKILTKGPLPLSKHELGKKFIAVKVDKEAWTATLRDATAPPDKAKELEFLLKEQDDSVSPGITYTVLRDNEEFRLCEN